MKVYFYTLGCKVNQYETQEMAELLEKNGYTIIYSASEADIAVVNSCTVTAESVRKTRQIIRKLKKQNDGIIIVLTGCASQAEPHIINELPEVDIFMGNRSNIKIVDALSEYIENKCKLTKRIEHLPGDEFCGTGITRFDGHTRAFLKIQDGCDRFCSYCLIPTARGRSRSKSLVDIDTELRALASNGYSEIVFVGINLSDYGKNTPHSLPDALRLAEKYNEIKRVRLGSLEPDHITDEMIEQLKSITKLCPQFHISVQSGCDSVLKAMNRHYTADEYEHLAKKLRKTFPDATITTDVLVGFPTETEEDFNRTVEFVKRVGFEKTHVFPYSVREGTRAAKMEQHTKAIKESRAARLSEVTDKIREDFLKEQIGKTVEVLFETEKEGFCEGYTKNYIPVRVKAQRTCKGEFLSVKITDSEKDYCVGIFV
ncbi:MAG: tRNA (N(6)-L-threonylcarbamoyladenosine(37)-C(2))-methylthiotransferase MtaB [Ruminococcaceae bacterium]|nr:tRNA (N(6)-L-threonylcarbamoyladenosine(37)-C(2))-methylthiotransferase MtaB [Oscillospiraceae bacterium]